MKKNNYIIIRIFYFNVSTNEKYFPKHSGKNKLTSDIRLNGADWPLVQVLPDIAIIPVAELICVR